MRDVAPLAGFPEPYGLLLAILADGTREWRDEVWDNPGPDVITWRAHPGGPSIGAIMLHMIVTELMWFERVGLNQPIDEPTMQFLLADQIDVDAQKWPDPPHQDFAWYCAVQDRYRERSLKVIREWGAPDMPVVMGEDNAVTYRWIMGHVIQHEAYHGGQIVMLIQAWKARYPEA